MGDLKECPSCESWRNGAMKVLDELHRIDGGEEKAPHIRVRRIGLEIVQLRDALQKMVNAFHGESHSGAQRDALHNARLFLNPDARVLRVGDEET